MLAYCTTCTTLYIFNIFVYYYFIIVLQSFRIYFAVLFCRDSWALATFVLILTVLSRKLQDISTEMPSWASSVTIFVLSNRAGRFLILTEEESKMITGDIANDRDSNVPESGATTRKSSWKHFVVIVDWLSLFCVTFAYIIMLIILVPAG